MSVKRFLCGACCVAMSLCSRTDDELVGEIELNYLAGLHAYIMPKTLVLTIPHTHQPYALHGLLTTYKTATSAKNTPQAPHPPSPPSRHRTSTPPPPTR